MNNDIVKYEPFWGEWYIEELLGKDINSEVYKIYKSTNGKKEYATLKYISISQGQSLILCKPQIRLQNDNIIYVVFVV